MSSVGRGLSSTGATEEDPPSAMQPTLSRSLVQVEPPRWFCSPLLLQATRARRAFHSQRGATAARKGERRALGSTLLLVFSPAPAKLGPERRASREFSFYAKSRSD